MPLNDRAAQLNRTFAKGEATDILEHALTALGDMALVSSFGAESVVLLHMASQIDRDVPVLFIDTEMLFVETLDYQRDVASKLGLRNVQVIRAERTKLFEQDNENLLHLHDPDACCHLRKTEPLQQALTRFEGWISGRKRYQGGARATLEHFDVERPTGRFPRLKVNPLALWDSSDLQAYITEHALPRHPLVAKGFPSVGCAPCTSPVGHGEATRAGRWRDQNKNECGIHFENGRLKRA